MLLVQLLILSFIEARKMRENPVIGLGLAYCTTTDCSPADADGIMVSFISKCKMLKKGVVKNARRES